MCMNQKSKADSGLRKTLIELKREIDESTVIFWRGRGWEDLGEWH